ncbi:hypothetical protein [Nostoc sp.]|uniref:hypothetical protein n=1 Tax=Nostoc sp. TaxID=1180 RepID=UPI002FF9AB17
MIFDFATATQNPQYQWEPQSRRYRDRLSGKFLSKQAIASLTQLRIIQVNQDLQQLGDLLLNGKITLRGWQEQFAQSIKILHTQQYLLGVGGQAQVQKEDYLAIARELKNQYKYLRNFAVDLTNGVMTPAQFKIRARMYAKAAKVSYFRGEKQAAKRSGLDGAYRVLGESDYHCKQCPQYAAMGVLPIDEVIYPTQRCDCRTGCLCNLVYVRLADVVENSEFETFVEFAEYIIDKQGRWRDPHTGKFIPMPDIKNSDIQQYVANQIQGGKSTEAQRLLEDVSKLKLLNLSTSNAYNATVEQLKRKYKNKPFALSLVSALQLDRGVSNKLNASQKLQELEKLLIANTQTAKSPTLKYKLNDTELSPIKVSPDDELEKLKNRTLAPTDKAALDAVLKYRESVGELNSIIEEAGIGNITDADYDRLYEQKEKTWKAMKDSLDATHDLKNDYLSEPILDEYMETMRKVSRESPGGYKIVLPSTIDQIKEKAKATPC